MKSIQALEKADQSSLAWAVKNMYATRTFTKALEAAMPRTLALSQKFDRTDLTAWNRVLGWIKDGTGDPAVQDLGLQLHNDIVEWSKIVEGSVGSVAGAKVHTSQELNARVNEYVSHGRIQALYDEIILPDIAARNNANQEVRDEIIGAIPEIPETVKEQTGGGKPGGAGAGKGGGGGGGKGGAGGGKPTERPIISPQPPKTGAEFWENRKKRGQ
jgi:uncharacterized membrane protein YgcG